MDIFREGKFEFVVMTEMKLKGNGEISWCGVNGIMAFVQKMERAKEGVAILLNDVWHSAVVDFGCVSCIILWIKFKFSRVKICEVVGYGPSEDGEERDYMDRTGYCREWTGIVHFWRSKWMDRR